jgi:NhaP-type Na+/H+ or K+/H+ antiporter
MVIALAFILLVFAYSLVAERMERTPLTAPMLFTLGGILVFLVAPVPIKAEAKSRVFLTLAEIALVLLLFVDATRVDLRVLRGNQSLPSRLLLIAMPLMILLGALVAKLLVPGLSIWEAAILAAVLAPTDASLGEAVVKDPRVPQRIRQALNVEAGLNDGLSVPFLLLFIGLAEEYTAHAGQVLLGSVVEQLGFGLLIGLAIGLLGGWLLAKAQQRGWTHAAHEQYGLLALPLLCFVVSEPVAASPFIAAFAAGLALKLVYRATDEHLVGFSDREGHLLVFFIFFVFGLIVARRWASVTPALALYAVLSLTLVRMLPVAISMVRTRLSAASVLFMGWFGPRGLASIVLGLVYLEHEAYLPGEPLIMAAVGATVLLSIFAHGLSASPGIRLYAQAVESLEADAPELQRVTGTQAG